MKKSLISAISALVLLLSIAVPSVLADEGPVNGSFTTANVSPGVTALEVYSDAALTTTANSLTPQVTYYVKVTAADDNTIDDIDEVEVHLFYDATGGDPVATGVDDTQTYAILRSTA